MFVQYPLWDSCYFKNLKYREYNYEKTTIMRFISAQYMYMFLLLTINNLCILPIGDNFIATFVIFYNLVFCWKMGTKVIPVTLRDHYIWYLYFGSIVKYSRSICTIEICLKEYTVKWVGISSTGLPRPRPYTQAHFCHFRTATGSYRSFLRELIGTRRLLIAYITKQSKIVYFGPK